MTRLEQVLERYLRGREIVIWGNLSRPLLRLLKKYKYHVAEADEKLDAARHYIVAVDYDDLSDFQEEEQSKLFKYIEDYLPFQDPGGELPFEWECYGAKIGRQSYFGDGVVGACEDGFVKSIGHFTSINGTAKISVNHQLNMIFTSDELEDFFTEQNKAIFKEKLKSDPQHPQAYSKEPITIGSDVYIGANVFINASKVTSIGDGAVIGSGAVVLEDVPPYAIVVGVPGKIKRYRYPPDMIKMLLQVKWWDWSIEEINANAEALMSPKIFAERFVMS